VLLAPQINEQRVVFIGLVLGGEVGFGLRGVLIGVRRDFSTASAVDWLADALGRIANIPQGQRPKLLAMELEESEPAGGRLSDVSHIPRLHDSACCPDHYGTCQPEDGMLWVYDIEWLRSLHSRPTASRLFTKSSRTRSMLRPVVAMEPMEQLNRSLIRVVVGASVRPFAQCCLNEAFGLSVGLRDVRPGEDLTEAEAFAGGSEAL
jgi:hypothetical protein